MYLYINISVLFSKEFLSTILKGDINTTAPLVLLIASVLLTSYVTIFIHKYVYVIFFGGLQVFCLLYYLASFIPGGRTGLLVLVKTAFMIVKTMLTPLLFVCRKTISAACSRLYSQATS